jgi:hypothetical protein
MNSLRRVVSQAHLSVSLQQTNTRRNEQVRSTNEDSEGDRQGRAGPAYALSTSTICLMSLFAPPTVPTAMRSGSRRMSRASRSMRVGIVAENTATAGGEPGHGSASK